jgi:signal transduction histidine kinase/CHASE1-domain containing sensor protein
VFNSNKIIKKRTFLKLPLLIAVILFFISLLTWQLTSRSIELRNLARFRNLSNQIEREISSRMMIYVNTLVQTRSMFYVTKEVDRKEFRDYVKSLKLQELFPGIQGIGYSLKISSRDLTAHEKKIRAEGFPEYKVWPRDLREDYFSIVYLEPFDWRNKRAFGFDMFTEPVRRKAMEEARDSGDPIITDIVKLVQETKFKPQPGFLIYVPVYTAAFGNNTIKERRNNLVGFVYSPFRVNDLFYKIHTSNMKEIGFEIFLGDKSPEKLIFKSHPGINLHLSTFKEDSHLTIAGGTFYIRTYSLPAFERNSSDITPWSILLLGVFVSFLSYFTLKKRESYIDLERERAQQSRSLLKVGKSLSAELDLEKLVQSVTDAGLELSKGSFGAFYYTKVDEGGELLNLFTKSATNPELLTGLFMPQNLTKLFPSHYEEGTLLSADITRDSRFGEDLPYFKTLKGIIPVKSYLAVSVISRTGELLGALIYGHRKANVFGEREQNLIEGIAAQAAIAIDNAKLFSREKEAVKARDEFLSIASHELKTPVTSMKLQFEMAKRMIDRDEERVFQKENVLKRVNTAISQLNRMVKLVEDMLESARFNSKKIEMDKEVINLNHLIKELIDGFSDQMELAGTKIIYKETNEQLLLYGDIFRIEQVFSNLITNALKYGDNKPIEISLEADENTLRIRVKDDGIGIAKDALERIFQRFERAISSYEISGLGLGLFITKQIVLAHDGKIWAESELGKGSIFIVEFPRYHNS